VACFLQETFLLRKKRFACFRLFLHIFTLKFVKYESILLILRKKSTKNTPKNQAKLVFRDALKKTLSVRPNLYTYHVFLMNKMAF